MLESIRTWFAERRSRKLRLLFRIFDGRKIKAVDPWQVYRAIQNDKEFDLFGNLEFVRAHHDLETTGAMAVICRAFDVQLFDVKTQRGLTEAELLAILEEFLSFCESIQKKTSDGSTLSQPTAAEFSTGQVDHAELTN